MTGVLRRWWWLLLGLVAIVAGIALIASAGAVGTCADFGVLPYGAPLPENYGCQDELDAAGRNFVLGSAALIAGLVVVAYGLGYLRGKRTGGSLESGEPVAS